MLVIRNACSLKFHHKKWTVWSLKIWRSALIQKKREEQMRKLSALVLLHIHVSFFCYHHLANKHLHPLYLEKFWQHNGSPPPPTKSQVALLLLQCINQRMAYLIHVTQLFQINIKLLQLRFTQSTTKVSSKVQYKHVHKAIHRSLSEEI